MAGGMMGGGGKGGGGGGGGGMGGENPVGMEFGGPPNADSGGGPTGGEFNANAMNTGDMGMGASPATGSYEASPAFGAQQAAQQTQAPQETVAPGGEQSGGSNKLIEALVGTKGLYNYAGRGTPPGAGGGGGGAAGGSAARGGPGWYSSEPGYTPGFPGRGGGTGPEVATPMDPLKGQSMGAAPAGTPQRPQPTPAPRPAPAPTPATPPTPPARQGGGADIPLPRPRPAEAGTGVSPPAEEVPSAVPTPEEVVRPALTAEQLLGSTRGGPGGPDYATGAPSATIVGPGGYRGVTPATPAPVSPQSGPAPGNTSGSLAETLIGPNTYRQIQSEIQSGSPFGKLLQGDFSGFFNGLFSQQKAMQDPLAPVPQAGAPFAQQPTVNRDLKGDIIRQPDRTAAGTPAATPLRPTADIARWGVSRNFLPNGPMEEAPDMAYTPGARQPFDPLTASTLRTPPAARQPPMPPQPAGEYQRYPGPGVRGSARSLGTSEGRNAAYQNWLKERGLPANNNTRTRFNIEYGLPKNLFNQATPEQMQSVVPKTVTPRDRIRQGFGEVRKQVRGEAGAKGDRIDRQTRREILRDRYLMKSDENARAQQQRYEERKKGRDPGPSLPAPEDVIRRNRLRDRPDIWGPARG